MTVAHYVTPELKPIKERGVKPDVTVDLTTQALRDENDEPKTKDDLILKKALTLFGEEAPAPVAVQKKAA